MGVDQSFAFGEWVVEPDLGRLYSRSEQIHLEPRVMDLVVFLAEHPGEVLSRESIIEAVWGGRIVSDEILTSAIGQIRRALHDDSRHPRFIETVPKRGYRFIGASETSRVGVTLPPAKSLEPIPYPGLSAFDEGDSAFFFGRQVEIELLWERVRRHRMLALIGPAGVGKTSFLRAGFLPSRPPGWRTLVCSPGDAPFTAVAESLLPDLAGSTDGLQELLHFEDEDRAVAALRRWRECHEEVLLAVDQFEELFTHRPEHEQKAFCRLLGRAAEEVGIHVLISMRDDFLIHCHRHPKLAGVFSELTPLGPLSGNELRRALVAPAELLDYGFEDDRLVETILNDVGALRGALCLMAFSMARLWNLRDRERKLITWEAYEQLGGPGGALRRQAEAVISELGSERWPIVREIFRNLVTAHGTRAIRDRETLLSIFEEREVAEEVLEALIAGRLLTCFEKESRLWPDRRQSRVEILHECLISDWTRLRRWHAKDAEGAAFRDQLRQATEIWKQRHEANDLLWNGSSYGELEVWRNHYPGTLTEDEIEFVEASMEATRARRRRRRRWRLLLVAVLTAALAVVGWFWHRSEVARLRSDRAQQVVRARHLLSLARLQEERSEALAFSLASLELDDGEQARRFAVSTTWRGPPEIRLQKEIEHLAFSPDGRWVAVAIEGRGIEGWPRRGGRSLIMEDSASCTRSTSHDRRALFFSPGSDLLAADCRSGDPTLPSRRLVRIWSVATGKAAGQVDADRFVDDDPFCGFEPLSEGVLHLHSNVRESGARLFQPTVTPLDPRLPVEVLGDLRLPPTYRSFVRSEDCSAMAFSPDGHEIWWTRVDVEPRLIGRQESTILSLAIDVPRGRVASLDAWGELRIWSDSGKTTDPVRSFAGLVRGSSTWADFSPEGLALVAGGAKGEPLLWDLTGPPDSLPVALGGGPSWRAEFSPRDPWLLVRRSRWSLWPLGFRRASVLRAPGSSAVGLSFDRLGQYLYSAHSDGWVLRWPLIAAEGERREVVFSREEMTSHHSAIGIRSLALAPEAGFAIVGGLIGTEGIVDSGVLWVSSVDGRRKALPGSEDWTAGAVAVDDAGLWVAAGGFGQVEMRAWNLVSGERHAISLSGESTERSTTDVSIDSIRELDFFADGDLVASTLGGALWSWSPKEDKAEVLALNVGSFALKRDGTGLLSCFRGRVSFVDLDSAEHRYLDTHGRGCRAVALSSDGRIAVSADGIGAMRGAIRVGLVTGQEPHLLLGHQGPVDSVAVSPDGSWVASAGQDDSIRIWPMPNVNEPPLHSLPKAELIARLGSLTNARVVVAENSAEEYEVSWLPIRAWPSDTNPDSSD